MHPFFIRNRMQDYIDDLLTQNEKEDFEQAIQFHSDLQNELVELQEQRKLLKEYGQIQAPEHLSAKILEEIDSPRVTRNGANNNLWFVFGIVVASVFFYVVIPQSPDTELTTPTEIDNAQIFPIPNDIVLPTKPSVIDRDSTVVEPIPDIVEYAPEPVVEKSRQNKSSNESHKEEKKQSNQVTFVIDPPAEAYVADWEVIETKKKSKRSSPSSKYYKIRQAESNVLFALEKIAKSSNGRLENTTGSLLKPTMLSEQNNFRKAVIVVPLVELNVVDQKLRQIGAKYNRDSVIKKNGKAIFPVEVTYKFY
jgi:hypothetical protein